MKIKSKKQQYKAPSKTLAESIEANKKRKSRALLQQILPTLNTLFDGLGNHADY